MMEIEPRRPERVLLIPPPGRPRLPSGTEVLARHLATGGRGFNYSLLSPDKDLERESDARVEPIYRGGKLTRTARLLTRLVRPDGCAVHHFLFTPHRRAVQAVRAALTVSRKPSVHTIPSQPIVDGQLPSLLFADRTVVTSEATALLMTSAGMDSPRVIRPGVPMPPAPADRRTCRARLEASLPPGDWEASKTFLYPGDLAFSNGAQVFVDAATQLAERHPEARFILACRVKTPAALDARAALRREVDKRGLGDRIVFLGRVEDMPTLLGSVDAVVLPVDTLYAKVDIPLVVLEAMALGIPAVVSDLPALGELAGLGEGVRLVPQSD
ncbi:MAG: glycosyltransferase family 4 protein, partial [Myxococcota bacterium]|nr:glycosyltransferase family 4 protein [Myxococcota bacterium]